MSEIRGLDAWMRLLSDKELPTLNAVVHAICELSEEDESCADDLTKIILRDADLTSRVLRIANSVHYNRSLNPIKTVSRAIIQLGFVNLRNITLASSLIDSFLKGKPRDLLIQRLARSFHAAVQARAMVGKLDSEKREQVFIAALLRHIGELAILASGQAAGETFVQARDANPAEEQRLSQEILGLDINQLNKTLIKEWALGDLVAEACEKGSKGSVIAQAVNLGNELSDNLHRGLDSPEVKQLCARVGQVCDSSTEQARKQILLMAEEASVIASTYGAERLLNQLPRAEELQRKVVEQPRTGYEFQSHLNNIHKLMLDGECLSRIMHAGLMALHLGSPMARVAIAMMDHKSKSLDVRYIAGTDTDRWRLEGNIELARLRKGDLLHELLRTQECIWYQPEKSQLTLGILKNTHNKSDAMLGALKLDKRIIAVIYADDGGIPMSQRQFEEFQLVINQLNLILRFFADQASRSAPQ